MSKQEFLEQLRKELYGLPREELEGLLTFYGEIIEDRMEEGLSEEEAVAAVGSIDEITAQAVADVPLAKIAKERMKPKRRLKAWEIVLLALGSPIWLSLGIAAFSVAFSLYVSLWSIVISFWAVFVSVLAAGIGGVLGGIVLLFPGHYLSGLASIGAGLVCIGLSVFAFYGCLQTSKGLILLTKKASLWLKNSLMGRGEAE